MSRKQVGSIMMSLLIMCLLTMGCTTTPIIVMQAPHTVIQIQSTSEGYEISVPDSNLILILPKNGFVVEDAPVSHPRYFAFLRKEMAGGDIIAIERIAGWFEPAERYSGQDAIVDDVKGSLKRLGYPPPQNLQVKKVNNWVAVTYEQDCDAPSCIDSEIRASLVQAGTWIDLHLSMGSQLSREKSRSQLIDLLQSIKVREVTAKDAEPEAQGVLRQSPRQAYEEIRERAERGEAFAQLVMGTGYLFGSSSTPIDPVAARLWFRRSAEQGEMRAQRFLGMMLANGWGGPADLPEAVRWYRKSAEQGDSLAQFSLALMYADGRGTPRDLLRSFAWLSLAIPTLPEESKRKALDSLARVEKELTPSELDRAKALANRCRDSAYQRCDL